MCRELKDSGIPWIGEIPASWGVMPHKRVMHKVKEIQEHYNGENILSLTMRGVIVRDLDAGGKMPTTFDGYQKVYPNNLLQCLFDIDVTPRCVGLIKDEGLTSPAYSQFTMYSNGYAPYYDYLLRYMDDRKTLLHLSKNLRSSLTETDFGAILTCVPPIAEQKKIAEYLDKKCGEVDEMIALQEQIIEELKAYKQSVITEAVTKGLNPNVPMKDSGIEWIGEIPEHWEVMPHKRVMHKIKEIQEQYNGEKILSLTMKGVIVRDLDAGGKMPTTFDGYQKVYPNNLLQCLFDIDVTPRCVGLIKDEGLTSPAYSQFELFDNGYAPYYDYLLRYMDDIKAMLHLSKNLRSSLTETDFGAIPTCVPPFTEQQTIADYLDEKCGDIDALIALKQQKIESLKEYKKSIIYEYVTGKKEVV